MGLEILSRAAAAKEIKSLIPSQEQSAGIDCVSRAIAQMEGAARENAALLAESSAAARTLSEQARNLVETT